MVSREYISKEEGPAVFAVEKSERNSEAEGGDSTLPLREPLTCGPPRVLQAVPGERPRQVGSVLSPRVAHWPGSLAISRGFFKMYGPWSPLFEMKREGKGKLEGWGEEGGRGMEWAIEPITCQG